MRWLLALILLLGGCTLDRVELQTKRFEVTNFVRRDLEAAHARAEAFGDEIAMKCWAELIEVARKIEAEPVPLGAADTFQRLRNWNRYRESDRFNLACGPLRVDVRDIL